MSTASVVGLGDQFAPGTMLGKYELLATIGRGGMANVILARQRGPAGFEKVVVIKVIHPHMAQHKGAVNMLLDEARVAAQIDHPNVVHTHELGEAHGTFYIVMEYLAGESFSHLLRRHQGTSPLDPSMAGRIVADAAAGLHAAHELTDFEGKSLEIVHRDVSPGNIVVLYNGNVKVVDFGIAKAHGRVTSTQDGELKGKYGYMSPEQIKNEPMDRRSDVFSLGVVLWEALTTRRLFKSDSVGATLMQILTSQRVPPSQYAPQVSPALDAVALKALAVSPDARYQTCAEMKQAIEDAIWQSRCGAREVETHMKAMFAERIEQRRGLLSRAARESLSERELELIGHAFKEAGSSTVPPGDPAARDVATKVLTAATVPDRPALDRPVGAQQPRRRLLPIAVLLISAGVGSGVYFLVAHTTTKPTAREPAPTVATATPDPVAAPAASPESTVRAESAEPAAAAAPAARPEDPKPAAPPEDTKPAALPEDTKPAALPEDTKPAAPPEDTKSPDTRHGKSGGTNKVVKQHKKAPDEQAVPTPSHGDPVDLTTQGTALYMKGDFIGAEAKFKAAIAANKQYAPAYRGLGFVYQRSGNNAKALDALRTYLKLTPDAKDAAAIKKRIEQLGG